MDIPNHSSNPHLDPTYGAMLGGVVIAAFFQGLLTVQAFNYFDNFPDDKIKNKIMVVTVVILDTVHLILITKAAYDCLVTNWGVVSHLTTSPIELNLHLIFTGLSVLVTQIFFLERIWKFSHGNIWIMASLVLPALVPFALIVELTVPLVEDTSVVEYTKHVTEVVGLFVSGAISDSLIAGTTYFYLKREKSHFRSTMGVLHSAIQNVVGTGIATSLIAIASLIAFLTSHDTSFYFIAIHFQLGRTYTNALLATLNSRKSMRKALGGSQGFKSAGSGLQFDDSASPHSKDETVVDDRSNIVCIVQQHTHSDRSLDASDEISMQKRPEKGFTKYRTDVEAPYTFAM